MRELSFALNPSTAYAARAGAVRAAFAVPRSIVLWSIVAHLAGLYVAARWSFATPAPLSRPPPAEFVWLGEVLPTPAPEPAVAPIPEPEPAPVIVAPRATPERPAQTDESRAPTPQEQPAVREAPRVLEGRDEIGEPITREGLEERRRRAAAEVIAARTSETSHLAFSLDDVAPPRVVEAPEAEPSIFDGTGAPPGPRLGQVGQARTKFGHRLSEICNALTGGFSLMGWGSFCAPAADGGHSGLFLEVLPWYLDALPECVETRPLDEDLGEETEFPTVKCRLVRPPDAPPLAVRELD
jgi:hypothetical protein